MISPKITFGGIAALAAVIMVAAIIFLVDRRATERAMQETERRDNAAADNADDARWRFDACPVGMWDWHSGKCRGAAEDRRN